jgi:diguanylate cyclase (GGDEF)-like protein
VGNVDGEELATQTVTLEQVLSGLEPYFQSLDIRCAALLNGSGPRSILTGVRISASTIREVKAKHAALSRRFGSRRAKTLGILLGARPFSELERLLEQLSRQEVTLEGTTVSLGQSITAKSLQRSFIGRFPGDLQLPLNGEAWPAVLFSAGRSGGSDPAYSDLELPLDLGRSTNFRTVETMVDAFLETRRAATYNRDLFMYVEMPARVWSITPEVSVVRVAVEERGRVRGLRVSLEMRKADGWDLPPIETRELRLKRLRGEGGRGQLFASTDIPSGVRVKHFAALLRHSSGLQLDELNFQQPEEQIEDREPPNPMILWDQLGALQERAEKIVPEEAGGPGLPGSGITALIGPFNALLIRVRTLLGDDSAALHEIEHIEPVAEMMERLAVSYHKKAKERIIVGAQHLRAVVQARYLRRGGAHKELEQKFKILWSANQAEGDFQAAQVECREKGLPISVIFFDIDRFKALNDRYTESVVDQTVLPSFMQFIRNYAAFCGGAYRQGGDEFVFVLPNFDRDHAVWFGERLRSLVERQEFGDETVKERVTISLGLACWPEDGESYKDVLQTANLAKKSAKERRNVLVIYQDLKRSGDTGERRGSGR